MVKCIAEHSVDMSLLTKGGVCIDAGCRGFEFSKAMRDFGMIVKAYDLEEMEVPEGISFKVTAIGDRFTIAYFKDTEDPNAKHILYLGRPVIMVPLSQIINETGIVDLLKLDIEGSEISALLSLNEPPAKQISVEFHLHTGSKREDVTKCYSRLQWLGYEVAFEDYSEKHGCGFNYWDVLFINKNIQ